EIRELRILGQTYAQEYATRKKLGTLTAADAEALSNKILDINREGKDKDNEIETSCLEFARAAREKATKNAKEASDKRIAAAKAARQAELQDILALAELNLLAVEKGGQLEIDAKKQVIKAKTAIELNAEKLT